MEIKSKQKTEIKKPKSFGMGDKLYAEFKVECEKRNISMSEVVGNFIEKVTKLLKTDEGGEIVIKIK